MRSSFMNYYKKKLVYRCKRCGHAIQKRMLSVYLKRRSCPSEYHKYVMGILAMETDPIDPRL